MARRAGSGEQGHGHGTGADSEDVLWAKYLDYCSARICDVFMELEEERVFELARTAEQELGGSQGSLSFREVTALLVDKLLDDLSLPDFEDWAESYRENPERYDPHLLGLWRTASGRSTTPATGT